MSRQRVVGVGIGLKFVGGKPQIRAALQYHVRAKLSDDKQIKESGSQRVPDKVGGYDTDVLEVEIASDDLPRLKFAHG